MEPGDLYDLATEFLEACVDALDSIPTFDPGLEGAPDRTFVSPGAPADDCCDQLTVRASAVNSEPIQPLKNSERKNVVTLTARATRCVPVPDDNGNPPSAAELEAAGEQHHADGWALWNHIFNLIRADLLFDKCSCVIWDGLREVNPSGGCGGWVLTIRVCFDGYIEELGS